MNPKEITFAILLAHTLIKASADQLIVPVPGGNTEVYQPFALSRTQTPSMRYQQVFANPRFLQAAPEGMLITAISFGSGHSFTSQQPLFQIDVSTTPRVPDGLSTVFSENIGMDNKTVFGPKGIYWEHYSVGYSLTVPLDQPFAYYPALGNLLLDVRNFQAEQICSPAGGTCANAFDAQFTMGDAVSRVFAPSVDALVATDVSTSGLGAVFTFTPIPEPGTISLWLVGFGAFAILCRTKRKEENP